MMGREKKYFRIKNILKQMSKLESINIDDMKKIADKYSIKMVTNNSRFVVKYFLK